MDKLDRLRTVLTRAVPSIRENPDTLAIFVDRGRVAARAGTLSFEYRYQLNLVVQDFAGSVDAIAVPLLRWIAEHQPELMQKADSEPFAFECDILSEGLQDVSITLDLTERVVVERVAEGTRLTHLPDTLPPDVFADVGEPRLWLGLADDLVAGDTAPA